MERGVSVFFKGCKTYNTLMVKFLHPKHSNPLNGAF